MFPYLRTVGEFIKDCETAKYCIKKVEKVENSEGKKCKHIILGDNCNNQTINCRYPDDNGYNNRYKKCIGCIISQLIGWLIQRVNLSNWGKEVSLSEVYAWCKSLGEYMKDIFESLPNEYKNNLLVGLEYYLEREEDGRADVMLIGLNDEGKGQVLIIELKQWSAIRNLNKGEKEECKGNPNFKESPNHFCIRQIINDDGEPVDIIKKEKKPTVQVKNYEKLLKRNNNAFKKDIEIKTAVYMHNLESTKRQKAVLEGCNCPTDVKVFYKGEEELLLLKKHIEELFPKDKQSKDEAKKIVQKIRNGYQTLSTEGIAQIIVGNKVGTELQDGTDFLRSDQRRVFDQITKRIEGTQKTIDIIYGVPGSGKTLIAACLANYVLSEGMYELDFTFGGTASLNAIQGEIDKIYPVWEHNDIFKTGEKICEEIKDNTDKNKNTKKKVIIIDEAHSLFLTRDDYLDYLLTADHIVVMGDMLQRLVPEENINSDDAENCVMRYKFTKHPLEQWLRDKDYVHCDKYELWTQFRCNAEDGYVSWINQVLKIDDDNSRGDKIKPLLTGQDDDKIYLSDLDFQPEIITETKRLEKILNDNGDGKMLVLTGNWINGADGKKELKGLFPRKTLDYSYIKDPKNYGNLPPYDGGKTIYIGNADCVHGVEVDNTLIIIGNELTVKTKDWLSPANGWIMYWTKRRYRVLLTRAMKKCYIYVVDKGLRERFLDYKDRPKKINGAPHK